MKIRKLTKQKLFYQLDFRSPEISPELTNALNIIRESLKALLTALPRPVMIQRLFNLILELFLGKADKSNPACHLMPVNKVLLDKVCFKAILLRSYFKTKLRRFLSRSIRFFIIPTLKHLFAKHK